MKQTVFYMGWIMDIGWANLYEQVRHLPGLRIQAAMSGVHSTETSTFILWWCPQSGHESLDYYLIKEIWHKEE